jgi:hypothetical protein
VIGGRVGDIGASTVTWGRASWSSPAYDLAQDARLHGPRERLQAQSLAPDFQVTTTTTKPGMPKVDTTGIDAGVVRRRGESDVSGEIERHRGKGRGVAFWSRLDQMMTGLSQSVSRSV